MSNSKEKSFFSKEEVISRKDEQLKSRIRTLIADRRLKECEVYHKLGITKQYWYNITWGIWEAPQEMKLKIAKLLCTDTSVIWRGDINGEM